MILTKLGIRFLGLITNFDFQNILNGVHVLTKIYLFCNNCFISVPVLATIVIPFSFLELKSDILSKYS